MKIFPVNIIATALTITISFFTPALAETRATGRERGTLRGREDMNAHLSERLGTPVDVLTFVVPGSWPVGLETLLGAIEATSTGSDYVSVKPTAVTMLVWEKVAVNLSAALAQACDSDSRKRNPLLLSAGALKSVTGLCRSRGNTPTQAALESAWLLLVGFRAPRSSFESWAKALARPEFTELGPKRFTTEALTAVLLDPNVLLVN